MASPETTVRYWLTFPPENVRKPILWEMSRKYPVIYDIRSASVTPQLGLIAVELRGEHEALREAAKWLRSRGVQTDPI